MNRRSFLAWLGGTAAGVAAVASGTLDVDRLLWVPGEKTILLPDSPSIVEYEEAAEYLQNLPANKFMTIDWISRDMLAAMENNLKVTRQISRRYRRSYRFRPAGKIGDTLHVRIPRRYA